MGPFFMPALFFALLTTLHAAQGVALPRAVPYLPQTEALCGGAAAAMVMRYWGAADAQPELFAPLIDPAEDGIVTTTLVSDLKRRGWQAFPLRGGVEGDGAALLRQHLSRGRPIIALIEDRPSRYHYVVVTAVDDARVHFHDPAIAPSQTMTREEFAGRWQAANYWMMLLLPGTTDSTGSTGSIGSTGSVLEAQVAALLRAGDTQAALKIATDATRANAADAVAWDALGTSLFVMDRDLDALEAWNRAGRPDIDTVQIAGLARTRYRAAEQMIDLAPGERLTAPALRRARRRLSLLPSAASSRVSYAPLADGRAQIDAAIVERSRVPGVADLIVAAVRAPFSRDIEVSFTNLVGGGERVDGSWRFREGFERIEVAVVTPAPLPIGAVWRISGFDARETFALGPGTVAPRRQRAVFHAADWTSAWFGWTAGAGLERWPVAPGTREQKLYLSGRAMVAAGSSLDLHIGAEGWIGGAGATRLTGRAHATTPLVGGRVDLTAGAEGVHGRSPRFLWPGAGDGHIRAPLLRAHPLVTGGAINVRDGQIFGRRLWYGTAEWTRPLARVSLASLDVALFTDAARAHQLLDDRASDYQIDAGAGIRVHLLGNGPTFRLDVARGLRDGRWALSGGIVKSKWSIGDW